MDAAGFLERWHRIVELRDFDALEQILGSEPSLGAPPYWQKLTGRDLVHHLLCTILETIEEFRYLREWIDGRELALEFRGRVGETELQGIDLITIDADGRLLDIDVMIRPLNAIHALVERVGPKMAGFLAARGRPG